MTRRFHVKSRRVRAFIRNRTAVIGAVVAGLMVLAAVCAPLLAPADPLAQDVYAKLSPPSDVHPLGADDFGRDVLSRIIYGARISLTVGIFSVLLGMGAGTLLGLAAGYFRGWLEMAVMRIADVLMAFPTLVMGLLVMAILKKVEKSPVPAVLNLQIWLQKAKETTAVVPAEVPGHFHMLQNESIMVEPKRGKLKRQRRNLL